MSPSQTVRQPSVCINELQRVVVEAAGCVWIGSVHILTAFHTFAFIFNGLDTNIQTSRPAEARLQR